jgi:hypothetical protein
MAIAMVPAVAGIAQAQEDRIEAECRNLLQRSVFNCGCTAEFLEDRLGGEQADILLRLWASGLAATSTTRCSISIRGTARRKSPTR